MTRRRVLTFPDAGLRAIAKPVKEFNQHLQELADDLLQAMRAAPGIGIAAPHIGVLERVIAIEIPGGAGSSIYVNPMVEWSSSETARYDEGSISMPGVTESIERPAAIRIRYQDLSGREQTEAADGLLAVCLQHEIDQLDGIFWIYRLSKLRRDRIVKRFGKIGNIIE
ncbi:peptide deformylase [Phyllobacterium sp. CCNWLW109]|uniref:peptide deformylase n=1 Tax=Phyllobacterium sp. CCNWLW109 TaxID=3127479 RepID=UPI003076C3CD